MTMLQCPLAAVILAAAILSQPDYKAAKAGRKPPKTESVMSPGMRIQAVTSVGQIAVTAVDELTRSYTWDGATRSVKMTPRHERWYGSLGLYNPGAGEHWEEHQGILRGVTGEGQQHFKTVDAALAWIGDRKFMPYVYRDDGLVVGWSKDPLRRQLSVEVWQILVDGNKPPTLPGSQNDKIVVTDVEMWATPLGKAVRTNDVKAVQELLAGGADPNCTNIAGRPALVEAARRNSHEVVRALLAKGARPNARSEDGSTALLEAANAGHVEAVNALLAGGSDINQSVERGLLHGMTPLTAAAFMGHAEVVKVLLEKGADVNAKSGPIGFTALYWAKRQKHPEVVRLLEEAGARD